jgi:hypothetical protein
MTIDNREFSQQAYQALNDLKGKLNDLAEKVSLKELEKKGRSTGRPTPQEINERAESYYKKSSSLVQGLSTYIVTWGLHRLSGDAKKFSIGTASDTQYKGAVYSLFIERLKSLSQEDFVLWSDGSDGKDEKTLVNLDLRKYTALNRLAIKLAKEWGFWAASVLGEAEE